MSLISHLDEFPPLLVRVVARSGGNGRVPVSNRELARRSGLTEKTVNALSRRRSWVNVKVGVASAFIEACGADLIHPSKLRDYLRRAKLGYLENTNATQRKHIASLLQG